MGMLKKRAEILLAGALVSCACSVAVGTGLADEQKNGETAFRRYCSECHFEGGNLVHADKTLSKADRERNGVRTVQDIIRLIRKPGDGMLMFDEKTLPDAEARAIAEYILTTF